MTTILEARHLSYSFGSLPTLNDISLEIQEAECVAIIGKSGCGKTTLLQILNNLIRPDKGEVCIDAKISMAYASQNAALLPWRTVLENVLLPFALHEGITDIHRTAGCALLKQIGLEGFENAYPHELSRGMAQRTSLARAVIQKPDILLLDEPFATLDALTRTNMNDELLKLRAASLKGTTIVFTTHSIDEAVLLADRVVILADRPASVRTIIDINLPTPRAEEVRYTSEFIALTKQINSAFKIQ